MNKDKTFIDEDGTERFVGNRIVRYIIDTKDTNLNNIWRLYGSGMFTKKEMKEFYKLIRYSVCGYEDIFND